MKIWNLSFVHVHTHQISVASWEHPGPAKSDFDLIVCFFTWSIFFYLSYDIYLVNSWKFPLVHTGCGTTWAIQTINFANLWTSTACSVCENNVCLWEQCWLSKMKKLSNLHWWQCLWAKIDNVGQMASRNSGLWPLSKLTKLVIFTGRFSYFQTFWHLGNMHCLLFILLLFIFIALNL